MKTLRTPDERFRDLPDYPFPPNYAEVDDLAGGKLRMHYVDEGPADGPVVLCLHGQPSWSYLYRKMIPLFTAAGCRVIAPDLVGFGRSDKPVDRQDYTFAHHVAWLTDLIRRIPLQDITLFCQDWGGLVGLRVAAENPDLFARIVTANTGLPDAREVADADVASVAASIRKAYEGLPVHGSVPEMAMGMMGDTSGYGFLHWVKFCDQTPELSAGAILLALANGTLSDEEAAAYDAPFPEDAFMAGAREFPSLVPFSPENPAISANRAAWKVFGQWEKPFLTLFSDGDPITAGGDIRFQEEIPGAKGQAHTTIKGAGHFLQEQAPDELVRATVAFMRANAI
jgi:haloalkane dehalogenase